MSTRRALCFQLRQLFRRCLVEEAIVVRSSEISRRSNGERDAGALGGSFSQGCKPTSTIGIVPTVKQRASIDRQALGLRARVGAVPPEGVPSPYTHFWNAMVCLAPRTRETAKFRSVFPIWLVIGYDFALKNHLISADLPAPGHLRKIPGGD